MSLLAEAAQLERELSAKSNRRAAGEARYLRRIERREESADRLIGELVRDGKTVFYINLRDRNGRATGKTREGSRHDLISYLLRNHYV